ncbi:MAG: glycosyltransferase [Candidatus Hydrogenedentes bacterium]|nr:glycosyltransferase [Candidatus Hydrogenedentota bacterium]
MHICHVYKDFYPPVVGGIEKYLSLISKYQKEMAEITVLVCGKKWSPKVIEIDGIRVIYSGEVMRVLSAPISPQLLYYSKTLRPDIFVVHTPNPIGEIAVWINRSKVPYVIRYHSDVVRQRIPMMLYKPFFKRVLREAKFIIPTSIIYQQTSHLLGEFQSKCRVVPLGIEVDFFSAVDEQKVKEVKNKYSDEFVFFCGVHRYYKGLHILLESAKEIDIPIVIGGDGPERKKLENMKRKEGLKNVVFVGSLPDDELKYYLYGCALFVFPSIARSEAFGISIIEAHACGKPVVATKLGTGVEWANLDGITGINVTPGNPKELAQAIDFLIKNPDIREEMGKIAKERVQREFDIKKTSKFEMEIYKMALNQ